MNAETQREYGAITLSDNAGAHLGDKVYHFHVQDFEESLKDRKTALIDSLMFQSMGSRDHNVSAALPSTCQWILNHTTFRQWSSGGDVQTGHNLLWIKGKPGSGKSTIMKEILTWAMSKWSGSTNLSFFFHARAPEELAKNSLGLYRCLVLQLLASRLSLRATFFDMFLSKAQNGRIQPWTSIELQNFLVTVIRTGKATEVNVFIDALDEGSEDDARDILQYFNDLADVSYLNGGTFRLCLSSRHYPHISVQRSVELILENQSDHVLDIELYIRKRLSSGSHVDTQELRERLLEKSAGIFLWVVLVISMLNPLLDRGRSLAVVRAKLEDLPERLSDLFAAMLRRNQEDFAECITLLRCVLYARRPLHAVELYIAVSSEHDAAGLDETPAFPDHEIRIEDFYERHDSLVSRYILDCSRGLVEETADHCVQFIHETVRTTLLHRQIQLSGNLSETALDFGISRSHSVMAQLCLNCLSRVMNSYDKNNSGIRCLFTLYAATSWWHHVLETDRESIDILCEAASKLLVASATDIRALCRYARIDQVNLYNYGRHWKDSGAIHFAVSRPSALYYAANLGVSKLVEKLLLHNVDVNDGRGRFDSPLHAASHRGYPVIVQQLLVAGAELHSLRSNGGNALVSATENGHSIIVENLLCAYYNLLPLANHKLEEDEVGKAVLRALNCMWDRPTDPITVMLRNAIYKLCPSLGVVEIKVNTLNHVLLRVFCQSTTTGREVKKMLEEKGYMLADRVFLLENTLRTGVRKFLDHWSLSDRNIRSGDRLEVVPRYRVGCRDCPHVPPKTRDEKPQLQPMWTGSEIPPQERKGRFRTRFSVFGGGEYRSMFGRKDAVSKVDRP